MNCPHCRAWVAEEDHRCHHCGRRLRGLTPVNYGATAPKLETAVIAVEHHEPSPRHSFAYQTSLFTLREPQKVVAIAPGKTHPVRDLRREVTAEAPGRRVQRRYLQQDLNFPSPPREEAIVEGVLAHNAKVASPVHRILAAGVDVSVILMAIALFVGVIEFMGGFPLTRHTLPYIGALAVLIGLFYKALWCTLGLDSPGMNIVGLRTLNFDGHGPTFEQRVCRMASGGLSIMAAGLGLLWALADEEKLTWHDHISRTFVTIDDTVQVR